MIVTGLKQPAAARFKVAQVLVFDFDFKVNGFAGFNLHPAKALHFFHDTLNLALAVRLIQLDNGRTSPIAGVSHRHVEEKSIPSPLNLQSVEAKSRIT